VHSHTARVAQWGLDENANFAPKLYGCTDCAETFTSSPSNGMEVEEHTHTSYVSGCFACKVQTLQMSTGDANGSLVDNGWTNKKWNNELKLYRDARAQGIQPDGTSTAKVRQAIDVSNKTGHAYGSDL
jgi:hypothetical protein